MQINWFTVVAQILNFLLLAWLLKRYLYKPILNAVDEREQKIIAQLEDAKAKEAQALKERSTFEEKNKVFDQQQKTLLDKAMAAAEAKKKTLLEKAKKDAEALRQQLEDSYTAEHATSTQTIVQKTQEEVFAIARKTLEDLATLGLEEQIVNRFLGLLAQQSKTAQTKLKAAFQSGSKPVQVTSAFVLPASQRAKIEKAVRSMIAAETTFDYKVSPALLGGIEVAANGYKISWSIAAYLRAFEKSIAEMSSNNP